MAHPQCLSICNHQRGSAITSTNFSDLEGSISFEGNFFSTPKTTPSLVLMPMAVDPNFNQVLVEADKHVLP
jgi:hypothetical protein